MKMKEERTADFWDSPYTSDSKKVHKFPIGFYCSYCRMFLNRETKQFRKHHLKEEKELRKLKQEIRKKWVCDRCTTIYKVIL